MDAKSVADLITWARTAIALLFPALALVGGPPRLPWVAVLLMVDWTGDLLDGALARKTTHPRRTWIGQHDLEVDMLAALGLLAYLALAGFVDVRLASAYLLAWAVAVWRWGLVRAWGMLFQAPIYGYFLLCALYHDPAAGRWLVAWILAVILLTWPRFPRDVVPGFLQGIWRRRRPVTREPGQGHLPPG